MAGDLLIKVSALDERELKKLCMEMEQTIRRNAAGRGAFDGTGEEDAGEAPVQRLRRLRGQEPEVQDANIDALFHAPIIASSLIFNVFVIIGEIT